MRWHLFLAGAWLVSATFLEGTASADPGPDHVTSTAGANDFNVKAHDVVTTSSPVAQSATTATVEQAPPPPPCTETVMYADCTPIDICVADSRSPSGGFHVVYTGLETGPAPTLWMEQCTPGTGNTTIGPSLPALVLRAFQRIPLPEPALAIQPPNGKTLIGLETIFSTQAEPFTRNLRLLGQSIQLRIHTSSYEWIHGDGTSQTTDWSGRPWQRGVPKDRYITHTYEHTGDVAPRVRVTWTAEYRVGNGPWQPVNGTVERTSPPATLQVLEAEPQLVAP
jgi:hypothetical protein